MPLNVIKSGSFLVAQAILHDCFYNLLLKLRRVAFVCYSFWHNKAPPLVIQYIILSNKWGQFNCVYLLSYVFYIPLSLTRILGFIRAFRSAPRAPQCISCEREPFSCL